MTRTLRWRAALWIGSLLLAAPFAHASVVISPSDARILYMGRIDQRDPGFAVLSWPSSAITVRFTGHSLSGIFSSTQRYAPDYLGVMIDGQIVGTPLAPATRPDTYELVSGLAEGPHTAVIFKRTEYWGAVSFGGLLLDDNATLLSPPPAPQRRIEFYGDSNVSAHDSEDIYDIGYSRYNDSWMGYAGQAARMLQAQWQNLGWGGAGWTHQSSPLVPVIWNYLDAADADTATAPASGALAYDFTQSPADVVVVNAGSNDSYVYNDKAQIIPAWVDFVLNDIRPVHPTAHVVLMDSVGWSLIEPGDYINEAVAELNRRGEFNVSAVTVPWLWGQQHAVVEEQAGFANILAAHIAQQMGWEAPIPSPLSSFAGTGRLSNTGFETVPYSAWHNRDQQASGWREWTFGSGKSEVITQDTGAYRGHRFARLQVRARGDEAGFWQATPVVPGSTCRVRSHIRANRGANVELKLQFKDRGQNVLTETVAPASRFPGWGPSTVSAKAPADAFAATVVLQLDGVRSQADFDEVSLSCQGGGATSGRQ